MKDSLTPQEQQLMRQVREEWTTRALSCQPLDEAAFATGIHWLYTDLLKKPVPKVVFCDSWHAALLSIAILKTDKGDSVWDSVRDSVRASVWASVGDSVGASVWDSVWDSVWASVWDSVWDSVGASVWDSVGASVWDSVGASVWDSVWEYSRSGNWSDFGWVSFYDYFTRIGVFQHASFDAFRQLTWSNCFVFYAYETCVFAVRPPVALHRNSAGRLHCTTGPAVRFADGSVYYYINGRSTPASLIEQPETITRDRFVSESNSDLRGAMYEILGQEKMLTLLGATEIAVKHANNETYTLYESLYEDPEAGRYKWVGVTCPSTATRYLLGVPPETTCPLEGVAGTFGLAATDYILRQNT